MSWKKYYSIKYGDWVREKIDPGEKDYIQTGWAIVFNDNCADPGEPAWDVAYRTEALAIKGAERLYKRVYGAFEEAFLGAEK